jgi:hypothetical protein
MRAGAQRGLEVSTDARGPNLLEQRLKLLRTRPEEAERLDRAISSAITEIAQCADVRRSAELRLKLAQLRRKRGVIQWPIGFPSAV